MWLFLLLTYWTGISFNEAKSIGLTSSQGIREVPREMTFPVPKGSSWHELYDYIRYVCNIQEHALFMKWVLKASSKRLNLHIHFTTFAFRAIINALKLKLLLWSRHTEVSPSQLSTMTLSDCCELYISLNFFPHSHVGICISRLWRKWMRHSMLALFAGFM